MKVLGFTGGRADYGQLVPVFRRLRDIPGVELDLVVCGSHLRWEFGHTQDEIEADGFRVALRADILSHPDTPGGVCAAMADLLRALGPHLESRRPDVALLLGDRYETLCMAVACTLNNLPVAHICGGEATFGAMDEAFRHSITKMSRLHFPSCEAYRRRIIQLGEDPADVYAVGSLGVEIIEGLRLLPRQRMEEDLGIALGERTVLVTFHPATLENEPVAAQIDALLGGLDSVEDLKMVFTKANADPGGRAINEAMEAYAAAHPGRVKVFDSLGQLRYLSAASCCGAVVGNSSSGITEAPSLRVPTVNIGTRQQGRIRAESVIDCRAGTEDIARAVEMALSPEFRSLAARVENPYRGLNASRDIVDILLDRVPGLSAKKRFHDLPGMFFPAGPGGAGGQP